MKWCCVVLCCGQMQMEPVVLTVGGQVFSGNTFGHPAKLVRIQMDRAVKNAIAALGQGTFITGAKDVNGIKYTDLDAALPPGQYDLLVDQLEATTIAATASSGGGETRRHSAG